LQVLNLFLALLLNAFGNDEEETESTELKKLQEVKDRISRFSRWVQVHIFRQYHKKKPSVHITIYTNTNSGVETPTETTRRLKMEAVERTALHLQALQDAKQGSADWKAKILNTIESRDSKQKESAKRKESTKRKGTATDAEEETVS
jgi:hypothetical protein